VNRTSEPSSEERLVQVSTDSVILEGNLGIPEGAEGIVLFGHGPIVKAIIDTAESQDVDLVAIASHGRSGLFQVFYGSVAAGVLQRIDRPLLLIRARESA
jgi:nucleotide-binding universal stress UspA family protein